jgi:hypothetical protein
MLGKRKNVHLWGDNGMCVYHKKFHWRRPGLAPCKDEQHEQVACKYCQVERNSGFEKIPRYSRNAGLRMTWWPGGSLGFPTFM